MQRLVHDVLRALPDPNDPLRAIAQWVDDAAKAGIPNPNAMALATSMNGKPAVRIVLLKGVDEGLVFYTNYESRKGRELLHNAEVAAVFYWETLGRQLRVEGRATAIPADESDAYFATRPRESQLGAWASLQSQVLDRRETLEARYAELERSYAGRAIPRPPHWGGFRIAAEVIEFWLAMPGRLHDRARFTRVGAGWRVERLHP